MKILLSPAKTMNRQAEPNPVDPRSGAADRIVSVLRSLSPADLEKQLSLTERQLPAVLDDLATIDEPMGYRALSLYDGAVFRQLDLDTLTSDAEAYLEAHVRVVSALYGCLTPRTVIRPYRLDINSRIKIEGNSLRQFWQDQLKFVFDQGEVVINLASQEFSQLFDKERYQWIDIDFYECRNGKAYRHSTFSKKARGQYLNYLIATQSTDFDAMKAFNRSGFAYQPTESTVSRWVFRRDTEQPWEEL